MDQTPAVSVIIPVYNAAPYLRECLDSLIAQTFADFEVICVDDGSSDGSPEILREYAENDPRFTVLTQDHGFAGRARNLGMSRASGRWLLFLDSDDRFMPEMLEAAVGKAEAADAEICVFGADIFDSETGKITPLPSICSPSPRQKGTFSRADDPDRIFRFTDVAPWNKLIRREFAEKNGLRFAVMPNSNDLTFILTALAAASRITTVPRPLLQYRINRAGSLQGSKERAPLAFYEALSELGQNLRERGLYEELERPFLNKAAGLVLYNLVSAKTDASFEKIFDFMRDKGIGELKLSGKPAGYYYPVPHENYPEMIRLLEAGSAEDFAAKFQVSAPGYRDLKRRSLSERIRGIARKIAGRG